MTDKLDEKAVKEVKKIIDNRMSYKKTLIKTAETD